MSVELSVYVGYGFVMGERATNAAARTVARWMGPDTEEEWNEGNYAIFEILDDENLSAFLKDKGMSGGDYEILQFGSAYDSSEDFTAVVLKRTVARLGDGYDPKQKTYAALRDELVEGVDRENLDWVSVLLLPEGEEYTDYGWVVGTLWH